MHVIFNTNTGVIIHKGANQGSCTRAFNRLVKKGKYQAGDMSIVTMEEYDLHHRRTKKVKNLMNGKELEIDVNTPMCCDPSTETYWSM